MPLEIPSGPLRLGGKGGLRIKAGGFDPRSITGLSSWLKADAGTSTTTDGTAISQWSDQSGSGNHATQATGVNQPVYKAAIVNSKPVVRFSGSSQYFLMSAFMSAFSAGTVIAVLKAALDPASVASAAGLWTFGSETSGCTYPFTDGKIYEGFGTTVRKTGIDPTPALTSWHVYTVRSAANDWQHYLDGTSLQSTATNTVGWTASPVLGRAFGPRDFNGDMAEFLFFNSSLSVANRQATERYLGAKYNITVA